MIGNDIIDLRFGVGSYTLNRREKWLKKIASPAECAILEDWPRRLWPDILWSIKESVFKCRSRKQFARSFVPKDIQLIGLKRRNYKEGEGIVKWNEESFNIRFIIDQCCLHSVATYEKEELYWQKTNFHQTFEPKEQSQQLRYMLLNDINHRQPQFWFVVENTNGLPGLQNQRGKKIPVSFSHHGQFGAWAVLQKQLNFPELTYIQT